MNIEEKLDKFTVYLAGTDLSLMTKKAYSETSECLFSNPNYKGTLANTVRNHLIRAGISIEGDKSPAKSVFRGERSIFQPYIDEITDKISNGWQMNRIHDYLSDTHGLNASISALYAFCSRKIKPRKLQPPQLKSEEIAQTHVKTIARRKLIERMDNMPVSELVALAGLEE